MVFLADAFKHQNLAIVGPNVCKLCGPHELTEQ